MHHPREGRSGVCHPIRISTRPELERNRTPRCALISLTRPSLVNEFFVLFSSAECCVSLIQKSECCVRLTPKSWISSLWIVRSKYSPYSSRIQETLPLWQFHVGFKDSTLSESSLRPRRPTIRTKGILSPRLGGHSLSRPLPDHRFPVHGRVASFFPPIRKAIELRLDSTRAADPRAEVQPRINLADR